MLFRSLAICAVLGAATAASAGVYTPFLQPLGPDSSLRITSDHANDIADYTLNNGRLDLSFDYYKSSIAIVTDSPGHVFNAGGDFDASVIFDVSDNFYQIGTFEFGVLSNGYAPGSFNISLFGVRGVGIESRFVDDDNMYFYGATKAPYTSGLSELRIQRTGDLIESSVNGNLIDSRHVGFVTPVLFYLDFDFRPAFPSTSGTLGAFGLTVITPEPVVCTVTQFCGGGGGTGPGVPEPASWALLIAGFGLTGAVMRRRRMGVTA